VSKTDDRQSDAQSTSTGPSDVSLADRFEIAELLARYSRSIDSGAADEWAGLFTTDGEFRNRRGDSWVGTERLREFAVEYAADPRYKASAHWTNNVILEPLGEDIRLFCHGMILQTVGDSTVIRSMSAYDDLIRKERGGWRFARRHVQPWPPVPAE